MKIIALAESNSLTLIDYKLVKYTVSKMNTVAILFLDMSNFLLPIYREDAEKMITNFQTQP